MLTSEALLALVERYCETVGSRDVDAYVNQFAEDAVQTDPASAPPNVGPDAIRAFWAATVEASSALRFEALRVHTCANSAAFEFRITVTLPTGTMTIEGIEVLEATEDGLIQAITAYWDDADVTVSEG